MAARCLLSAVKPEMLDGQSKRRISAPLATSQMQRGCCRPAPVTRSLPSNEKLAWQVLSGPWKKLFFNGRKISRRLPCAQSDRDTLAPEPASSVRPSLERPRYAIHGPAV